MTHAHPASRPAAVPPGTAAGIWRPDLATGIRAIDREHEQLLASVHALREAARTGDLGTGEQVLAYLERYAAEHFAAEERAMWETGYPGLDAHWSLHLSFATVLARRKADYAASRTKASVLFQLARWMDWWLEEHLLGADAEMARHLRAHVHDPKTAGAR